MGTRGEIASFDQRGNYVRALGRRGQGPGEYGVIFPIRYGPGDSLSVFDLSNRRLSVLSPGLDVVRTVPLPALIGSAIPLPNGAVVIQASIYSADRIGLPIHLMGVDGKLKRSFGGQSDAVRPGTQYSESRRLALASDGRVWAARVNEYTLELWDTVGTRHRRLEVPTPWFKPWVTIADGEQRLPLIVDVQVDQGGLLWVLIVVADASPRSDTEPPANQSRQARRSDEHREKDTVLELVDPTSNRILASHRFDEVVRGFACERTLFAYHEDPDGTPRLRTWHATFTQRR
jgi:hypothetical protein